MSAYVYIVKLKRSKDTFYKIGYSVHPVYNRYGYYKRTFDYFEEIDKFRVSYPEHVENLLHMYFKDKRYTGYIGREYFSLDDNDLELIRDFIRFWKKTKENKTQLTVEAVLEKVRLPRF